MANAPTGPLDPSPSSAQSSSPAGDAADDPAAQRRAQRAALLERRASLPQRARLDARIEAELATLLDWLPVRCLGFYWPIQQEFDARGLVARWLAGAPGRDAALRRSAAPACRWTFIAGRPTRRCAKAATASRYPTARPR